MDQVPLRHRVAAMLLAAMPLSAAVAADRAPEQVYRQTCGYCHGANVGPVIRGRGLDPAAISYIVRHGLNAMPAFRPTEITPAELAATASWLQHGKADPAERGR